MNILKRIRLKRLLLWLTLWGYIIIVGGYYFSHFYIKQQIVVESFFERQKLAARQTVSDKLGLQEPATPAAKQSLVEIAEREAIAKSINPSLVVALIDVESNWRVEAISPVGAIGLMQIMPFNLKRCGLSSVKQLVEPVENIKCGVKILSEELDAAKNDAHQAIQTYNGGAKCYNKCAESVEHARRVMVNFSRKII